MGRDSSVGIATGYGLDGPGIESRRGEIFRTCPDRPLGPPSLVYNGYRVFPGGKERPGRDADPSPSSSAVGHEKVELYLYSPYGPYGLYRASVPVQGWPLPLPLHYSSQVSKSGISDGEQSGTLTGFLRALQFALITIPMQCDHSFVHLLHNISN